MSMESFVEIIVGGTLNDVATAVRRHAHLTVGDLDGKSPLMYAADRVDDEATISNVVFTLLREGARTHAGVFSSTSPLCYAARKSPHVLRVFAFYEQDWDKYKDYETRPWEIALSASSINFKTIWPYVPAWAMQTRTTRGSTLLIEVVKECPEQLMLVLADSRMEAMIDVPDVNGETPLAHAACLKYDRKTATYALLKHRASLLYWKNDRVIAFAAVDETEGQRYMRNRIRFPSTPTEFDARFTYWYN